MFRNVEFSTPITYLNKYINSIDVYTYKLKYFQVLALNLMLYLPIFKKKCIVYIYFLKPT